MLLLLLSSSIGISPSRLGIPMLLSDIKACWNGLLLKLGKSRLSIGTVISEHLLRTKLPFVHTTTHSFHDCSSVIWTHHSSATSYCHAPTCSRKPNTVKLRRSKTTCEQERKLAPNIYNQLGCSVEMAAHIPFLGLSWPTRTMWRFWTQGKAF